MTLATFDGERGTGLGASIPCVEGETATVVTDLGQFTVRPHDGIPSRKGYLKIELNPADLPDEPQQSYLQIQQASLGYVDDLYRASLHNQKLRFKSSGSDMGFDQWRDTFHSSSTKAYQELRQSYLTGWLTCHNIYLGRALVVRFPGANPNDLYMPLELGTITGWDINKVAP